MALWKPCLGLSMHAETGFVTSAKKRNQSKMCGVGTERGKGGEKDGSNEGREKKMNVSQVQMDFKMLSWAMPAQLKTLGHVPGK